MTARHKFIKPRITSLLLEVSIQTLHLLLLPMLLYSAVIRGNDTASRFSFGESTPLFSKDLSVRGHALFIPKAHFATQNATSFVTENCHYTTYKVPEGLFFFLQQLYAQQIVFDTTSRSSFSLLSKARYQFTDCYATVQMFNYYAQVRRKWKLLYHVVSDELLQTFHNKVGG